MKADLDRLERDLRNGINQLLVLAVIRRDGPIHGYGIIQAMEAATGLTGDWKEGTIYPILSQLDRQGILRSRWGEGKGARRKYYELTTQGERGLKAARLHWDTLRDAVDGVLEKA